MMIYIHHHHHSLLSFYWIFFLILPRIISTHTLNSLNHSELTISIILSCQIVIKIVEISLITHEVREYQKRSIKTKKANRIIITLPPLSLKRRNQHFWAAVAAMTFQQKINDCTRCLSDLQKTPSQEATFTCGYKHSSAT